MGTPIDLTIDDYHDKTIFYYSIRCCQDLRHSIINKEVFVSIIQVYCLYCAAFKNNYRCLSIFQMSSIIMPGTWLRYLLMWWQQGNVFTSQLLEYISSNNFGIYSTLKTWSLDRFSDFISDFRLPFYRDFKHYSDFNHKYSKS